MKCYFYEVHKTILTLTTISWAANCVKVDTIFPHMVSTDESRLDDVEVMFTTVSRNMVLFSCEREN